MPGNGANAVARAWIDLAFRRRLLENRKAAVAELGLDLLPQPADEATVRAALFQSWLDQAL